MADNDCLGNMSLLIFIVEFQCFVLLLVCLGSLFQFFKMYRCCQTVLLYSTMSKVILIILELLHLWNLSSIDSHLKVLKMPALIVNEVCSILCLTGNIGWKKLISTRAAI